MVQLAGTPRTLWRRAARVVMRSHAVRIPKYALPVRFRPWFAAATAGVMLALAFLGFTNWAHALPVNDKVLHFVCFGLATGVFYFIVDVEDEARRIWFWRHAALMLTAFVCMFCGGVLSEFVQGMLPYKTFQVGDIVANLLGAGIGLEVSRRLEYNYRKRREIARLYTPLGGAEQSDDEEEEDDGGDVLPRHNPPKPSSVHNVWADD